MNNPSFGPRTYLIGQVLPALVEKFGDQIGSYGIAVLAVKIVDATLDEIKTQQTKQETSSE